jgi:phosphotransferase system enzyme I (PtsI)
MSFTLHGIGVSPGIAIGPAHLVSHATLEVAHYVIAPEQIGAEQARLSAALASTRAELAEVRDALPASAAPEFAAFVDVHQMILADATLSEAPLRLIAAQKCNAEWALKMQLDELLEQFDAIDDAYLRERKQDVLQVVERVMKALTGTPGYTPRAAGPGEQSLLVAHDLSPADIVSFKRHRFAGFLTDVGGATSHTAIVARSLGIPALVALHRARALIREDDLLIVDGEQGVVIVNPDPSALAEYRLKQEALQLERAKLQRLRPMRASTLDRVEVELHANIEGPDDLDQVRDSGATGIGLYRTEFLFMNRDEMPDEDEQFEAYRRVLSGMDGMPVTIRTLDIGNDKTLRGTSAAAGNPALGLRAIRLCLAEPEMFRTQLRALYRASCHGDLRILIPMLCSTVELAQALTQIELAKRSLAADGLDHDPDVPLGGMIEIPAAALAIEAFLARLDFVSIGTNDLIQYTLAIDRADDSVAHLYDPLHPAVLMLIWQVIQSAHRAGVPVAVCGEMAGDVDLTRLLLGMGLREFSMHPTFVLEVKQQVLRSNVSAIEPLIRRIVREHDPERVRRLVAKLNA